MASRIYGVALFAFKRLLRDSRLYFALMMMTVTVHYFTAGVVQLCHDTGASCSPAELFTLITSAHSVNAILYLIWIMLICSVPFVDEDTPILVLRSGRGAWNVGQVCHIALTSLVYWTSVFIVCTALLYSHCLWSKEWSRVTMTLIYTTAASDYAISFDVPAKLTVLYSVWNATLTSFALHVLVSIIMGLCALFSGRVWGMMLSLAFILLDISFYGLGLPKFVYYSSPVSLSDLSVLDPTKTDYLPSVSYAFLALSIAVFFLVALCQARAHRKDFTRSLVEF